MTTTRAMATAADESDVLDVLIVGAGISGINAAYRIQEQFPKYRYTIFEGRDGMGGTWDLFRYPGIRSDSDLHTFGFSWRPWNEEQEIAQGAAIRRYIKESAAMYGIDKRIQYRHKVRAADWSSKDKEWTLTVDADDTTTRVHGRFLLFCTGYYDYEQPLPSDIPGLENFKGLVIHPQFWPEDLDYTGKKVSIVGSGATAITLLPVIAETAKKVTMVQRSPGYIVSLPAISPSNKFLHRFLPTWLAYKLVRFKNLTLPFLFFKFCRAFPNAARKGLRKRTQELLPANYPLEPHFQPRYNPWEQRLCVCPDADFFESLRSGKGDIATGVITEVDEHAIHVHGPLASDPTSTASSDTVVASDIIITATGLKLRVGGGAAITVDGAAVLLGEKFLWKGIMVQDVPNAAMTMGYTNMSWTLGADATALHVCRVLKMMAAEGATVVVPRLDGGGMAESALLNLNSTYVQRGRHVLPKAGDRAPWKARASYWWDIWEAHFGNLRRGLQLF